MTEEQGAEQSLRRAGKDTVTIPRKYWEQTLAVALHYGRQNAAGGVLIDGVPIDEAFQAQQDQLTSLQGDVALLKGRAESDYATTVQCRLCGREYAGFDDDPGPRGLCGECAKGLANARDPFSAHSEAIRQDSERLRRERANIAEDTRKTLDRINSVLADEEKNQMAEALAQGVKIAERWGVSLKDLSNSMKSLSGRRAMNKEERDEILSWLGAMWDRNPELRLGQLIGNVYHQQKSDLYYVEDYAFILKLSGFYEELRGLNEKTPR